jgi:excisionase family DNA binding protein
MLKLKDIRKMFNISKPTLHSWIKIGKLKAVKIGGLYFVKEEDVKKLIDGEC